MEHRKEHNKVRMQLAGNSSSKERSPYGTPKGGRSPLLSPLVGNAAQVSCAVLTEVCSPGEYGGNCHPQLEWDLANKLSQPFIWSMAINTPCLHTSVLSKST